MIRMSYQQFAIVQADSAQQLTDELNRKLYELKDKEPTVTFDGLIARISYREEVEVQKTVPEYSTSTVKFKCKDCPMFEPVRKRDGTPDRRTSFGFCRFAKDGQTLTTSSACKELYRMINEREVKLCLRED